MKATARHRTAPSVALAVLSVIACGGSPQAPANDVARESTRTIVSYQPVPPPADTSTSAMPSSSSSSQGVPSDPATTPIDVWGHPIVGTDSARASADIDLASLDDAQLAAVVQAVEDGEIRLAQLGMTHSASPHVKRFARDMLVAHEGTLDSEKAILSRLQITPAGNAVSRQVDADTQNEAVRLAGLRGPEFDREFLDAQVRNHGKALDWLDRILPNIKSAPLKADLTAARPKFEARVRMAESLRKEESRGVAAPQPTR